MERLREYLPAPFGNACQAPTPPSLWRVKRPDFGTQQWHHQVHCGAGDEAGAEARCSLLQAPHSPSL